MVLEWLSRLLSGFSSNLGGSFNRGIWSQGRGSVLENQFQDKQLEKFTSAFTYKTNVENISNFLDNLSNFSYAEQAVNRVNQQRQVNLDFIDSEVEALRGITIPTPDFYKPIPNYERVGKRPLAGEVASRPYSYGSGGGVRRWYWINPMRKTQYEKELLEYEGRKTEFSAYKTGALNQINTNISNLLQRRDLITSKAPFSL